MRQETKQLDMAGKFGGEHMPIVLKVLYQRGLDKTVSMFGSRYAPQLP